MKLNEGEIERRRGRTKLKSNEDDRQWEKSQVNEMVGGDEVRNNLHENQRPVISPSTSPNILQVRDIFVSAKRLYAAA